MRNMLETKPQLLRGPSSQRKDALFFIALHWRPRSLLKIIRLTSSSSMPHMTTLVYFRTLLRGDLRFGRGDCYQDMTLRTLVTDGAYLAFVGLLRRYSIRIMKLAMARSGGIGAQPSR